jgi:hypothetical protein
MRLAIIGTLLAACACTSANGNGDRQGATAEPGASGQRAFEVGAFQSVELAGPHDVVVTVGGAPSVRAEGDAEAIERLHIRVEDGELKVGTRRDSWFSGARHGRATVYVTAPSLTGVSVAGSGGMRVDRIQAETFDASIAGSGNLDIAALQARRAEFSIAGSGNITAAGTAEQAEVDIAGSGNARLDSLQARRAEVSIAGSGDINLQASEAVEGSIMGAGNVNVRGTARCSVTKMGSGEARCGA